MATFDLKASKAPYMELEDLAFRCYTTEEIEKLSVLRVTETQSFDSVIFLAKNL
jgi:hypothetical protein